MISVIAMPGNVPRVMRTKERGKIVNDTANFVDQHPSAAAGQNLDVVDRVSEVCFGLFIALSFVGAVSTGIPEPTPDERCCAPRLAATWPGGWSTP